jgi:hypothetical protein
MRLHKPTYDDHEPFYLTDEASILLLAAMVQQCPNHGGNTNRSDLKKPELKQLRDTACASRITKNGKVETDLSSGRLDCSTCLVTKLLRGMGYEGQCVKMNNGFNKLCQRCGEVGVARHFKYCPTCRKAVRRELDMARKEAVG